MGRPGLRSVLVAGLFAALVFASPAPAAAQASPPNDLDAFMEKVLERRAETWRRLQEYVLDEREQFELLGPGDVRLFGQQRLFNWYVRDGYLIRSPLKFNGVALSEEERRKYEDDWLKEEKEREQSQNQKRLRRAKEKLAASSAGAPAGPFETGAPVQSGIDDILREGGVEPRFISEAYFLQFKFEPGNYYLVGRERLDNHEVLKIEYYPRKRMFEGIEEEDREEREKAADKKDKEDQEKTKNHGNKQAKNDGRHAKDDTGTTPREKAGKRKKPEQDELMEEEIERKFNKVSLVTLWVDPVEHQIVKYIFDLPDFGFLPGRWAIRVDDGQAAMTMGQPVDGVWLPRELSVAGGFTLASGGYRFRYARAFYDYKLGEVRAKIRGYDTRER